MVRTSEISHSYKGTQNFIFPDIHCEKGSTLLVLGQSGVGKTTLLHILGGILKPANGEVVINKQSVYKMSGNKLDKFRGQNIGIVFQKPHFVHSINAEENLFLAQKMAGQQIDRNKTNQLLRQLNLDHRAKALSYKMSQGEQQRLSIARAVINSPQLILADEPTSALDDNNCKEVVDLLEYQAKELKAALIIVTHDKRLKDFFNQHIELS
jgi:putative ABC transport system ATP-binding protein